MTFYANQTGEFAVSPPGPATFIDDRALHPGQTVSGSFRIANQTGVTKSILLSAEPSASDLNATLRLRLASGGETLREGPLDRLGTPGGKPLVVAPGESATVDLAAHLETADGDGAAAALVQVAIQFEAGSKR